MHTRGPILNAYDGSSDADYAIGEAAELLGGGEAIILYVRQPLESVAAHLEGRPSLELIRDAESAHDTSERIAARGASLARDRGCEAAAQVASTTGSPGAAIVDVADDVGAALIVMGSRGHHGLKGVLLGSVSHHVSHHARRPTFIIPSPDLAHARATADERLAEAVATR